MSDGDTAAAVEPREPAPATCEVCDQAVPDTVYWADFGPVCVGCCNDMWACAHDPLREALVEARAYVARVGQHDPAGIDLLDAIDEALG